MDETIGVKGGHNDRRKVLINIKKKKDKELEELEKDVKRKQKYTLIKTLPIVIVASVFQELTSNKPKKKKKIEEEKDIVFDDNKPIKKEETKSKKTSESKQVIVVLKNGTKQVIEVPIKSPVIKQIEEITEVKEEIKAPEEEKKEEVKEKPTKISEKQKEKNETNIVEEKKHENSIINLDELTDKQKNKLQKLQARKIIDVYEKQLKDIRYDLRNLIIEYNTLIDEEDKTIKSKEEEKILDKLNEIIRKIEELKEKIKIEDLDKYDDNYIYTLIEGYLSDFKDKKIIKEIKDSELYILISDKLDEFDRKKDKFKEDVEDKKEELEVKEENFEKLKEKYTRIDKINKELNDFYREQELILKEMQEKIDKSVTVTERVKVQIEMMDRQTSSLLTKLSFLMLIPGRKGAKALAAMFAIYRNMARMAISPKTVTKKYKEIKVYDYSKDIEKNIKEVEKATQDLSKTGKEVDKIISQIKEEFADYIGVIPECNELLSNLQKVKSNIKEKEYELEKIKYKQEKELERNKAKLLTKGTYNM